MHAGIMQKLKPGLFTVACLALALAVAAPAGAAITGGADVFIRGFFNLAEAYPGTPVTYPAPLGITESQVFAGLGTAQAAPPAAAPGILCLQRQGGTLDVNCFAAVPARQTGPCFVQSYRLIKTVPGSIKCPDVYGFSSRQYFQFGAGVRTWWALSFTQPGTQFVLEVTSVCLTAPQLLLDPNGNPVLNPHGEPIVSVPGGQPRVHIDLWIWQVVADVNTLASLIELMHEGAVSTLEVPCIIGEDMYDALKAARQRLADAVNASAPDLTQIQNAIFDFEALIVSNCLFVEVLNPLTEFPGPPQFDALNFQPPGNLAPTVSVPDAGTAIAGIIDTTEHPCCCKLLVDLEWIASRSAIAARLTSVF